MNSLPVSGFATFVDLKPQNQGSFQLSATYGALSALGTAFIVLNGAPFAFSQVLPNPISGVIATTPFTQVITASLVDEGGSAVLYSPQPLFAQIAIATTTAPTGVLSGTKNVSVVNGVASFPGLSIDVVGTYQLGATIAQYPAVPQLKSAFFAVSPSLVIARLNFSVQPVGQGLPVNSTNVVNAIWSQQPVIQLLDAGNNIITTDSITFVDVALTDPNGANLLGVTHLRAVAGVVSFASLRVDKVGTYSLSAIVGSGSIRANSSSFTIVQNAAPAYFTFVTQIPTVSAAVPFGVTLQLFDRFDNPAANLPGFAVQASLTPAFTVSLLTGVTSRTSDNAGVVTFSSLILDRVIAAQYTILFTLLTNSFSLSSNPFTLIPGPATGALFVHQPSSSTGGIPMTIPPSVRLVDSGILSFVFPHNFHLYHLLLLLLVTIC